MWKVEYFGWEKTEPLHTWQVTCDTFVEARAVSVGRLEKILKTTSVLLGAIRNGRHAIYLRGVSVGELRFTEAK